MKSAVAKTTVKKICEAKAYELASLGVEISRNINSWNHVLCCIIVLIVCFVIGQIPLSLLSGTVEESQTQLRNLN